MADEGEPKGSAKSDSHPTGDPHEIVEYWTEERRRAAVPAEPPSQELAQDSRHLGDVGPSGPPEHTEWSEGSGGRGDPFAAEKVEAFVTGLQPNPSAYPQRTVGKLFYTSRGRDFVASGVVVNRSGILTAAHCTRSHEDGQWSTNVAFAPAYDNGFGAFGLWPVGVMFVANAWLGPPVDLSFDFSFCRVPTQQGLEIGDVVGYLGILINQPNVRMWHDLGYPSRGIPGYNFDGQRMWTCTGDYNATVGGTIRKDGNLTDGASGGPWIVESPDPRFLVNGTYSMWFNDPPTLNTSPYFRDAVMHLFNDAFG